MGCCCSRSEKECDSMIPLSLLPFSVPGTPASAPVSARGLESSTRVASSPNLHDDLLIASSAKLAEQSSSPRPSTEKLKVTDVEDMPVMPVTSGLADMPGESHSREEKCEEISFSSEAPSQASSKEPQAYSKAVPQQVIFQPGLRGVTMNLEDISTSVTRTPSDVQDAGSFASSASGGKRHRDDFGAGFGGHCGECGKIVYANRGCSTCKMHICKTCFQNHERHGSPSGGSHGSSRRYGAP